MSGRAVAAIGRWARTPIPAGALFRRVVIINGLVFTLGTLVLALSPASVSSRVRLTEIPVLVIGLAVILAANAFLLRSSLAPIDELITSMHRVDPLRGSTRLHDRGNGDWNRLIDTFNAMAERLETERSAASTSALAAQENERQRIARELHDEIGQSLTVALLRLRRTHDRAPAELHDDLHAVQETVRACLDEVRGIARRLRPDVLEDLGLPSALAALCNEFATTAGITVTRDIDPDLGRLDPDTELVCYRVAQECLTNIARHAHATRARLLLTTDDHTLLLRIRDDGTGTVAREGAGMRGMRERALHVNATLTIDARPGHGTDVQLVIPTDQRRSS
ncbi:sensor histidine kinase [Nocardia otitidiscaviarum]|uniref:sensor histidine kinase n=1 Tax=Nocardia otitidiscaviarum TaxID=1823 RepID=UPI0024560427|nr:histidine kinase [Nocardia otitidiscaviarum]